MKKLLIILMSTVLCSCGLNRFKNILKNKYIGHYKEGNFNTDRANGDIDSITIDDTYTAYKRQVCRKSPDNIYYSGKNPGITASTVKCNCDDKSITYQKEVQEIQYLFISKKNNSVIYITTIPPTIRNNRMTYDNNVFKIPWFVNINYFNTFFFGSLANNNQILFNTTDTDRTAIRANDNDANYRWVFQESKKGETLDIVKIITQEKSYQKHLDPKEIVQPEIRFYKQDSLSIGLCDTLTVSKLTKENNNFLENKRIYFTTQTKNGKKKVTHIAFAFETSILKSTKPVVKKIYFEEFRLKSAPILGGK